MSIFDIIYSAGYQGELHVDDSGGGNMSDTFTGDCILADNKRLRSELSRCLAFIRTIPDNQARLPTDSKDAAWTRELWAIKREIKI